MNAIARPLADTLATLPPEWPADPLPAIQAAVRSAGEMLVVLDDDPTGTQSVHGISVLTEWPVEALRAELDGDRPAVYLLTNSRSMPLAQAQALNAEIGRNIRLAAESGARRPVVVSRSDSTLRGHFPGEVDALAEALGGGFDATLLIPAFIAGGRYTIDDVHYVADGDQLIPAGQTDFARDATFGYQASNMCEWVEEKTEQRVSAAGVASVSIAAIRSEGPDGVAARLAALSHDSICVVNAASERDLAVAALGILQAELAGKRFLYRTAASIVPLRAGIEPRPLLARADLDLPEAGPSTYSIGSGGAAGLIVVGSYVSKTSGQVAALLEQPDVASVEVRVDALLADAGWADEVARVAQATDQLLRAGQNVAIFTSRRLVTGADAEASLAIGRRVSDGLVAIVRALSTRPRYLLAKGGITSSDTATRGLDVKRALVLGQILPGVPVWRLGPESRYPGMIYIVFPGNVGGPNALVEVVAALR
ncbi:MAG TPA: four-carbon acid sugar kinase family protein [Roseiflexaceae bacterium]|nr:four-carbon acid sugar kinase family protein [Roseiflexaceae bacterium]